MIYVKSLLAGVAAPVQLNQRLNGSLYTSPLRSSGMSVNLPSISSVFTTARSTRRSPAPGSTHVAALAAP